MESRVKFVSFDGTQLEGTYRSVPRTADAVAVLVHGINSSRDELGLFSGLAESLAATGVPSFRFDYRCHGTSNKPIESMTLSGIVNDIEAASAVAVKQSGASKIHVLGMSFGGGLAAFWASSTDLGVISVVMMAPVIDYVEDVLGQHGAIADGRLDDETAKTLAKNGFVEMDDIRYGFALVNELRFISGVAGIQRLKCPSLIIHGDADSIVPYSSSEKFSKLRDDCRLVNIPGTDHGFGVEDDDDLSSLETKEKHREVFRIVSDFYEGIVGQ
ncbi:MAG: alpha/beta fold hydrolase [Pirellulaceae bacterium]